MTDPALDALITLHRGLPRQGPGDDALAGAILDGLPLPPQPRIADLGCGSGASSFLLAARFGMPVVAVDLALPFLAELRQAAARRGLSGLVLPVCADMTTPPLAAGRLDLVWSEGAAYAVGFAEALAAWRPLLAPGGHAVVSEMTWFANAPPQAAREYWTAAYPGMATEAQNVARAEAAGFSVRTVRRLSQKAWWTSYYDPLRERIDAVHPGATAPLAEVIAETRREIDLFAAHAEAYGYAFYVLAA